MRVIAAAALALLGAAACTSGLPLDVDAESNSSAVEDVETSTPLPNVQASPAPPVDARPGTVSWVFDGDSLDIDYNDDAEPGFAEVRLIGINAPEADECLGEAAKDALIDRLGRESVAVAADRWDEFGRQLVYVWHENKLINLWLIEQGWAVSRSAFGHQFDDVFDKAEAVARDEEAGLWSPTACGGRADTTVSIAEVNFDAAGPDNENPNGEWIDLTNTGPIAVDITGWTVRDESTRHRYTFPRTTLEAGANVRLRSGCGTDTVGERYWCDPDGPIWSNSGDTAFVHDRNGALVDSTTWDSIYDS